MTSAIKRSVSLLAIVSLPMAFAAESAMPGNPNAATIVRQDASGVAVNFDFADLEQAQVRLDGRDHAYFLFPGEGTTYDYDRPLLPMVSRFIIVPPDAGLELHYDAPEPRRFAADLPPALCRDEDAQAAFTPGEANEGGGLYPPQVAEMSEPVVVRGVRMVKVSVFPVQYDPATGTYLQYDNINAEVRFTADPPVNPALHPDRKWRSRMGLKYLQAVALNGDILNRDDPDYLAPYVGHYLIVLRVEAINLARPFIEWRRKAGYKVDILPVTSGEATNPQGIKNRIRALYNDYLEEGIDPFDEILIIGDRTDHQNCGPAAQWLISAEVGNSVWGNPVHADYLYATLEGNDSHMDCGISRWTSGNPALMGLFIRRTLGYEATPNMDEPEWFTRGAVGSQHWGNAPQSAWHVTIHTNVRWAEELLQHQGYDDVRFYERYEWDRMGEVFGPWERDQLNDGVNVILVRAENYYWRNNFQGVNNNTIFPIRLAISGHGEWTTWWMTRSGDYNNPKGPVCATNGWGGPPTLPMSITWLNLVKGFMVDDLSFGWSRVFGVTNYEKYVPNVNLRGQPTYLEVKTDVDATGDPGLMVWKGVPRQVEAVHPATITPAAKLVEVYVHALDDEEAPIAGAQVTLYNPGRLPDDWDDYIAHEVFMTTMQTNSGGIARFVFEDEQDFERGTMFVTVTGRDILPFFGEMDVAEPASAPEISEWTFEQVEGNDDEFINPGEVININITAGNLGDEEELAGLTAVVTSASPWLEVEANEISFGDVPAGEEAEGDAPVLVRVSPVCPDASMRPTQKPSLTVTFASGDLTWRSAVALDPVAPNFQVRQIPGGNVISDTLTTLDVEVQNIGRMDSPAFTARLISLDLGISVVDEMATFNPLQAGRAARIDGERFRIAGNRIVPPGWKNDMLLVITTETGFVDSALFTLQVGTPRDNAPIGPDEYGYICFDDTDRDWDMAPQYDWVEIDRRDNNRDYDGERLEFEGRSPENVGETIVVDLPFRTRFYGYDYDQISVCTNGYISMGEQPRITNFQNWPMDEAVGGGCGMIAPFWDWLKLGDDGQVYTYYDEEDARFIVEWSRLRHYTGGNEELIFQVILYDADVWITESGNPNILFQYKSISQVRGQQDGAEWEYNVPFASVGISSPDGTGISYTFNNRYPTGAAPLEARRAILFSTSPKYKACILYGRVTDFATGFGIERATVFTKHGFTAVTDEGGYWRINDALAEVPFDITAMRQGYNDSTEFDIEVAEGDSLEINFALLHPEFSPNVWELREILDPGLRSEQRFTITNTGNGPLNWQVDRRLLGDANAEPWEFRRQYPIGDAVQDDRIEAVAFVDNHFYIAAANGGQPVIYVMTRDSAIVDTFPQPKEHRRGIRDLAWDGQLLWGAIERTVYSFNLEGEVQDSFNVPEFSPITSITYDPDREVLWLSSTTTNIIGYSRDGVRVDELELNRRELRIYGLAYFTEDPENHNLYVFHKDRDSNAEMIHKFNIDTGDTIRVATLTPPGGGTPGGCFITNQFDVYSYVFLAVSSASRNEGGDRLDIWQIEARKDWFQVDELLGDERRRASSGVIQTGASTEFILSFNSTGLPDTLFQGELFFTHNSDSGVGHISVVLDVIGPVAPLPFDLAFPADGDTLDSTNVTFVWQPSIDLNRMDEVTYKIWITHNGDTASFAVADTAFTLNLDDLGWNVLRLFRIPVQWWVEAISGDDIVESNQRFRFNVPIPSDMAGGEGLPVEFTLAALYPNPFNSVSTIRFGIDRAERTRLRVLDMLGREVTVLFDGVPSVGWHTAVFNGGRLPSGVYLIRMESGDRVRTAKTALVR